MGDDKRRPYANNSATRPGRGDPRGRPSRIQHGFPYFVRGRRPPPSWRPVPTQTRPSGTGIRHGRRQASPLREQLGDEARVGATLAVAHPESNTASLTSYEVGVPHPRGVPCRPKRGRRETGIRHGRRQASPLREQLGDEARVGATLAVAHPESNTASLTSYEVGVPHPRGVPCRPKRGRRETGIRHGRRQASPLREQLGDEAR